MSDTLYRRRPLAMRGTIPVFSTPDEYTANYEQIAADHIRAMREQHIANPFIPEDLWVQTEAATAGLIEKYSRPGDMILDVGVGLGRLLTRVPLLRRYGMDISFGYLELAQSNGIDVCYARIEDIPYRDETFDVVVCTDVLEHVLDVNVACARILSVLKRSGTLIVRVPYREDLSAYVAPTLPYRYVHLRSFDEHSLFLLFTTILRCDIIEMQTVGYAPSDSSLRWRLPIPKFHAAVWSGLSALKMVCPPVYPRLVRALYHAFAINVVIKRT